MRADYFVPQQDVYLSEDVTATLASSHSVCGLQCQYDTQCAGFAYQENTYTCKMYTATCSPLPVTDEMIATSTRKHMHLLNEGNY